MRGWPPLFVLHLWTDTGESFSEWLLGVMLVRALVLVPACFCLPPSWVCAYKWNSWGTWLCVCVWLLRKLVEMGAGSLCFLGTESQFGEDEKVLEMDAGGGCRTV